MTPASESSDCVPKLSLSDEIELRAYFGSFVPHAPGERSSFGPMCARLGQAINPRTNERPTADAPWTEILDCRRSYGGANLGGDDAMVAYLDARRRFGRVCEALSKLSTCDQQVLDAYYGCDQAEHPLGRLAGVAALTEAAQRRNRARAARGLHEPIEVTVRWLAAATASDARTSVAEVREQAHAMFNAASNCYARARAASRRGR